MTLQGSIFRPALVAVVLAAGFTSSPALAKSGPIPELISPEEGGTVPAGRPVVFTWRSSAKIVRIEVARDAEFTDVVEKTAVKGSNAGLKLSEGTYYWRLSVLRGTPSEPRKLTVGEPPAPAPDPAAASASARPARGEPASTGSASSPTASTSATDGSSSSGFGLDLTGSAAATPEAETPAVTESAPPEISSTDATAGVASSGEPVEGPSAEAERPRSIESPLRVFIGGGAATSLGAPVSISTFRYEGGVAYRVSAPLELGLAIGGTELSLLGTRDATWPLYDWLGQFYADLSVRYRVMKLGPGVLFALGSGRLSFFTAQASQLGLLRDRQVFSVGVGVGYRFRAGIPLEVGLRGNVLTGKDAGGELELGLRAFVF